MLCSFGDALLSSAVDTATKGQYVLKDNDGINRLLPDKAADFLKLLEVPELECMVGGSGDVYVSRRDPILNTVMIPCPTTQVAGAYVSGGQARAWVQSQLDAGKAVLVSLISVVGRQAMCAVMKTAPSADKQALAAASADFPVLATPTTLQNVTSFFESGFGLLAAASGVVLVLAWASGVFTRKHHTANRPRGSRKPSYGRKARRRPRPAGVTWALAYHGREWSFDTKEQAMRWSRENFSPDERKYVSLYKVG